MNKFKNQEQGSVLTIVALMILVFILFLGLVIDGGYTYLQRTRLQQVADAEALACVISPSSRPCPQTGGEALYTELNPYGFDVAIENPGNNSLCLTSSQTGCARATALITWDTFLIRLAGFNQLTLSATAVAGRNKLPSCIITVGGLELNGGDVVTLTNCSASIGSKYGTGLTLKNINKDGIVINGVGNTIIYNTSTAVSCPTCNPPPSVVSTAIPSLPSSSFPIKNINGVPLATLPASACTNSSCVPAIYTGGSVKLTENTVLQTGYYIFMGGLDTNNKDLSSGAGGVGLYIPGDKKLELKGAINLTAPSVSGCTEGSGIVLSHPYLASSQELTLGGGTTVTLTGVVNLSADDITFNGLPKGLSITGSLIANSLKLNGNINPIASSNPCFNLEEAGNVVLVD